MDGVIHDSKITTPYKNRKNRDFYFIIPVVKILNILGMIKPNVPCNISHHSAPIKGYWPRDATFHP
jgi:hypothetical protein